MRLLERELGVELLRRTTHEVDADRRRAVPARARPGAADATDDLWRGVTSASPPASRAAVVAGLRRRARATRRRPRLLEAIARRLPALEVSARVMATAEILDAVGDGDDRRRARALPARARRARGPRGAPRAPGRAAAPRPPAGRRRVRSRSRSSATSRCCCTRARPTRATTTPCSPSAARRGVEPRGARAQPRARPRADAPRRRAGGGDRRRVLAHGLPAELTWLPLSPPAALERGDRRARAAALARARSPARRGRRGRRAAGLARRPCRAGSEAHAQAVFPFARARA